MDAQNTDRARQSAHERQRGPTMWARAAVQIIDFVARDGALRAELMAALGPGSAGLGVDSRVPLEAVYAVLETAVRVTGDDTIGLRFAQHIELGDLAAIDFLMMTSPTLGDACERFIAYQRVWNEGERYELLAQDDAAHVTFTPYGPPRPAHRQIAEMAFCDLVVNGARLLGRPLGTRHIRFRHPRPANADHYQALFGIAVTFGAPVDEVVFPRAIMALPLPDANAAMCAFFARHVQERLDALAPVPGVCEQVRVIIADNLHAGDLGLDAVATRLGMSARTLQRRLRAENASLHGLIEQVRRERSVVLLGTPMAIGEIAYLLGYSEPSAFHRAFKRWTGATPEAFRGAR
jgi:AraC-like DNA-binding protein